MKRFADLTRQDLLAISNEEDSHVYCAFAGGLRQQEYRVIVGGVLVFLAGILIGNS